MRRRAVSSRVINEEGELENDIGLSSGAITERRCYGQGYRMVRHVNKSLESKHGEERVCKNYRQ